MKIFKQLSIVFFIVISMIISNQNDVLAATATVDTSEVLQTMEGFGASIAWWYYNLNSHTRKGEIYNYLFKELGLDILRLRNIYRKGEDYGFGIYEEIVDSFYSLSENEPKVMISSWSPPADLKSNNDLVGGTLDTTATGKYVYGDFVQYWVNSLDTFAEFGIEPDYISIQNEPSFEESHETCKFTATENSEYAGYDRALDSVYLRLQELASPPKILAPEVLGIGYYLFQNYANEINHNEYVYGYAYHLYHGGDGSDNKYPDEFIPNLTTIANNYSEKPIFQTEYDLGGWFKTAWLMHNCLVYGNVSGYFYWTITSTNPGSRAFVVLGGSTYTLSQAYWAFRQYSKAIHYGWKRVGAEVDKATLLLSAYINSTNDELSVVVINTDFSDDSLDLSIPGLDMTGANIIRTSDDEQCALAGYYDGFTVNLPARSITTISTLEITPGSTGIDDKYDKNLESNDCFLAQNYPNPFTTSTTIEYSISNAGFVHLAIYDIAGQKKKTLIQKIMPAGKHTLNVELNGLPSGIYFYKLKTAEKNIQKKMILIR